MGITTRDIITWAFGLVSLLMGIIFKAHNERLRVLEKSKADTAAVELQFKNILERLDRQDRSAENRDKKLDDILFSVTGKHPARRR